jgi:predicted GIY-YIG superfamily endonuclease
VSAGPGQHHWLPGRTALYRLRDTSRVLLYIGISENPEARFARHESLQPWWPQVDHSLTTIEWLDTRKEAEAAEDEAIRTEHALYNVARSPWAPKPRELGPNEATVATLRNNLTEAIARVQLLDTAIVIAGPDRARTPYAGLVPPDIADLIDQAGGLREAREALRRHSKAAG